MKINPQRPPEAGQDAYLRVQKPEGKEAIERTTKGKTSEQKGQIKDSVHLSDKARKVEELRKAVDAVPEVRQDRVQALKRAIQEGTYRIDAEKIAQKMLEEL
ncbi:MAG: flagellar biosynthesis anti-sigma factor FlgM [Nitrospirae bacterium]|nr:MAG: flagellar biosynthesis anti-sigma factor FlgM [Nitrospirota bacterium]